MSMKTVFLKAFWWCASFMGLIAAFLTLYVIYVVCVSENVVYKSGEYRGFYIGETKKLFMKNSRMDYQHSRINYLHIL